MKPHFSASLVLFFLVDAGPFCFAADEAARQADIQRELNEAAERMMQIWPGDYKNDAQMVIDRRRGFTSYFDGGHAHVHSKVVAVENPGVGERLLYVEDSLDDDENNVFRQKLYQLTTDIDRGAVVLTLHSFHEPDAIVGAHRNPSLLADLTDDDLKQRSGCQMYFRPLGDGYLGALDYGACTTDTGMVADNRMFIAPGLYWFSDTFRPATAPRPHASIDQNWHRLVRVGSEPVQMSAQD